MSVLIELNHLHFRPPSLPPEKPDILSNISLEIATGAFVAIVGENGSGKTTLIKLINGLLSPTNGSIHVCGLDTRLPENLPKLNNMVGMVFQNPADQIVASTVEEDVAFGLENLNLPSTEIQSIVNQQIRLSGLQNEKSHPPHLLSGGQIQKVALAGVLARKPQIILFDEPTTMLDSSAREVFLSYLFTLNHAGITILYVTHHMDEVVHADQVVVMHKGNVVLNDKPENVFQNISILYEIGLDIPEVLHFTQNFSSLGLSNKKLILTQDALLAALPAFTAQSLSPAAHEKSASICNTNTTIHAHEIFYTYLANTSLAKQALNGASIDIFSNSIHGIAGGNGSGKSTLLQHFNGILRPISGTVQVKDLTLSDLKTALRDVIKHVGLVFQSPEMQFFENFVGDEIAYGPKQLELDNLRVRVRQAMMMVGLDFDSFKDRRLDTLSGGEKRKVAIASTLVLDQDILLFDEPTAGMDPRSRNELLNLFQDLKTNGRTIVIASHRLDELAKAADHLSIMKTGKVNLSEPVSQVFSRSQNFLNAGLSPPLVTLVTEALIQKGWPLQNQDTSTINRLTYLLSRVTK